MATRPLFVPVPDGTPSVSTVDLEFKWHPGFAVSQRQKNVDAMHERAADMGFRRVLEISTKSASEVGRALSAFNLAITWKLTGERSIVEGLFQGSKVFEGGGPYHDLYSVSGREAKRDPRVRNSGPLLGFNLRGTEWGLEPKTAFYDWLYVTALLRNPDLAEEVLAYDGFTDVEFNPKRSINCQAHSAALFVAMQRSGRLADAPLSPDVFVEVAYGFAQEAGPPLREPEEVAQLDLFGYTQNG